VDEALKHEKKRTADTMKCFYHPEIDAIGLCKNCSRAFCMICAAEVSGILYCRGGCEAAARAVGAGPSKLSRYFKILCQLFIVSFAMQVIS
jgi:hypothetical protein